MVWIKTWNKNAKGWVMNYYPDLVDARKKAIALLGGGHYGYEEIEFYRNQNSKTPMGWVEKDGHKDYEWKTYSRSYGVVRVPLYKNGKIQR